ncbi:S-adenosyl-L-methionine-dependent methyltransferase [Lactarius hatsudake]|nr:S-adenosyl-L-methionine-dependent methyltransferase [Lactarius hatsudake]
MADTTTTPQIAGPGKDIYWHGAVDQAEIARLDAMHNGIKNYFDGKLSLAPLNDPLTILDIGSGSGIWAIECAEYFPGAKVTAVRHQSNVASVRPSWSLSREHRQPHPSPVPSNFQFQRLDVLTDSLPWAAGSLDVVHVRFLLIHLPEPRRVLERIAELVKPGGWLLIEEVSVSGEIQGDARAVQTGFELVCKLWESNGQVPAVGSKLQSWLRQTGTFSEVNVHEALAPVGSHVSPDPRLGGLGLTFKNSWRSAFSGKTHPKLLALGFAPEFKERLVEEFDTLEWRIDIPLSCISARRSV